MIKSYLSNILGECTVPVRDPWNWRRKRQLCLKNGPGYLRLWARCFLLNYSTFVQLLSMYERREYSSFQVDLEFSTPRSNSVTEILAQRQPEDSKLQAFAFTQWYGSCVATNDTNFCSLELIETDETCWRHGAIRLPWNARGVFKLLCVTCWNIRGCEKDENIQWPHFTFFSRLVNDLALFLNLAVTSVEPLC